MAGVFGVAALAAGLSTGISTGAAQAAVMPSPSAWYELWVPYVNPTAHKCLDVPDGSMTAGVGLQIYHCHGSASDGGPQRWYFTFDASTQAYQIWNYDNGWCLDYGGFGAQVKQGGCGLPMGEWRFVQDTDGTTFMLQNAQYTDQCLSLSDASGNDHTQVTTGFCNWEGELYHNQQAWELG